MTFNAQSLIESPEYFPLKFEGENLVFTRMNRENYRQSIFTLPGRISSDSQTWTVPFRQIANIVEQANLSNPSPSCIFQVAHCGSTLLSRALDLNETSLVIREPLTLRQICATPPPRNEQEHQSRLGALKVIWALLSRRFGNETVIIKGNVPLNYCLDDFISVGCKRSLFLYSNLQDYLSAILKSPERKLWVSHLVKEMGSRVSLLQQFKNFNLLDLSAAQESAILWLSQIRSFESALKANKVEKKERTLESQSWFMHPSANLQAAGNLLDVSISQRRAEEICNSELFNKHSKLPDQKFSEQQRRAEQNELNHQFDREFNDVLNWLASLDLSVDHSLLEHRL